MLLEIENNKTTKSRTNLDLLGIEKTWIDTDLTTCRIHATSMS